MEFLTNFLTNFSLFTSTYYDLIAVTLSIFYPIFGFFIWRLRGGAWSTWLGINMGTQVTRFVTGILLSLPLLLIHSTLFFPSLLILAILLGLILAGWGPFMGMGVHTITPSSTWLSIFPKLLGLTPQSFSWDFVGMFFCGIVLILPCVLAFNALGINLWSLAIVPSFAMLFAVIYLIFSKISSLPLISNFASNAEEWSECGVGILISVTFLILSYFFF